MTLEKGLTAFLDAMLGKNRSAATLRAYRTDVLQFIAFLTENNVAITEAGDVGKVDVLEYLAALARKGLSGVARARKVSAIREYFRAYRNFKRYFATVPSGMHPLGYAAARQVGRRMAGAPGQAWRGVTGSRPRPAALRRSGTRWARRWDRENCSERCVARSRPAMRLMQPSGTRDGAGGGWASS